MTTQLTDDLLRDWASARAVDGIKHFDCMSMVRVGDLMRVEIGRLRAAIVADHAKQAAPAQDDEALLYDMDTVYNVNVGRESVCPMRSVLAVVRAHDAAKQASPEQAAPAYSTECTSCGLDPIPQDCPDCQPIAAPAPEQAAQPVAWLICGSANGNELQDWELEASQKACDDLNELPDERRVPLYASPPPAAQAPQPMPEPITDDEHGELYAHCEGTKHYTVVRKLYRNALQAQAPQALLEALLSCRGTVKTELNNYERLALVHGKTPHGATYEAEAQRLSDLLDKIDAIAAASEPEQAHSGDPA